MRVNTWNIKKISDALTFQNAVLVMSHSDYRHAVGGTEKVLHREQDLLRERSISYIQLFPLKSTAAEKEVEDIEPSKLFGMNVDSQFIGNFTPFQLRYFLSV